MDETFKYNIKWKKQKKNTQSMIPLRKIKNQTDLNYIVQDVNINSKTLRKSKKVVSIKGNIVVNSREEGGGDLQGVPGVWQCLTSCPE